MGAEKTLEVLGILGPAVASFVSYMIKAFVNGDEDSYRRVKDILPETLAAEALLAHERARLNAGG